MIDLIRNGGVPILAVLAFGLTTLIASILFARRPEAHKLRFLIGMSLATTFASLNGLAAGLATTLHMVSHNDELGHSADAWLIVMAGISESLGNPILGFTLLTLASFVTAIGLRRMPRVPAL